MNIYILVNDQRFLEFTGIERLKQAAEARGHTVEPLMEPLLCFDGKTVLYEGKELPPIDVIIHRPTFIEEPSLHEHTLSFLEAAGYRVINSFPGVGWSKNKISQHRIMTEVGIPLPRFAITKNPEQAYDAAERLGFPVVVKVAFGTHGKGVFFADTSEVFSPIVEYLILRDRNPVLIEEYISEANRTDLRVFVVGEEVVATMKRTAPEGDVRANTSNGGTGSKVELTNEERDLAIHVAKTFQLEIAGIDLIRSNRGPLVLEINSNPGFEKLENSTGFDVAGAIIDYVTK